MSVGFTVRSSGNVDTCTSGTLVVCEGSVDNSGNFRITGNDGETPVDTRAALQGKIDASGNVTGTYSGTSVSDGAFSGSLSGSRTSGTPAPTPQPGPGAGSGNRSTSTILMTVNGADTLRKVSTQVLSSDPSFASLCGKTLSYAADVDSGRMTFSCPMGVVGSGSYVDGQQKGEFEWGYVVNDNGSLNVKSYEDWGDHVYANPYVSPQPNSKVQAAQIFYRFTTGEKRNRNFQAYAGQGNVAGSVYIGPIYYFSR